MLDELDQPMNAITYGWRSWFYLLINFGLGMAYFMFMILAYTLGFGLSIVWIGLPILALAMSLTRRIAGFDRWLAAKMMGIQLATVPDDLDIRSANPLHIVGAHLSSATTWQNAVYLLMKMPLGMTSLMMATLTFPFLSLETLLSVFGIHTGAVFGKIVRAMAAGLSGTLGGLTQPVEPQRHYVMQRSEKAKRRLEMDDDPGEGYYIDDDGEISAYKRKN